MQCGNAYHAMYLRYNLHLLGSINAKNLCECIFTAPKGLNFSKFARTVPYHGKTLPNGFYNFLGSLGTI